MKNPLLRSAGLTCALSVVAAFSGFSSNVQASTDTREIRADMSQVQGAFSATPQFCVGAGRANEGLRADWQRQLADVHDECGFRYLRFHGLLCDDMGVCLYDHGKLVYNWQYIDELFDSMLSIGVRPFVELGFMPSALASGPSTIFWWKGNVTPPRDYDQWADLIGALLTHWTERYGADEVSKWYFEVWNEPNLSAFWIGDRKGMDDKAFDEYARKEYFKLYKVTAEAVKSVNAAYRVGGPATAGNAWIPEMIEFCRESGAPIDFISTHNYAVMAGYLDEDGNAGTVFCPDRDAMIREVKGSREKIEASSMPGTELYYTEWSASYTPSDPIHDSYHSAAFILNKLKGIGNAAQSMSYWTFTDIFEEAGPRATPFHGGFGLINYQDIRKPAFYAYRFIDRLGPTELRNDDPDSWVCRDDRGGVQALVWDFTITHPGPSVNNQDFYNHEQPAAPASPAVIHIGGLAPGSYVLRAWKVGYKSNDAYTAYLEMGAPAQLAREQVAELKSLSNGAPFAEESVQIAQDGVFERSFRMLQNDVLLVTLDPQ